MRAVNRTIVIFVLFHLLSIQQLQAQSSTSHLEKKISLNINSQKTEIVLSQIADQANFTFSYNPKILDGNKLISLHIKNKTVRETLNEIFTGKIIYKEKGSHIILLKAKEEIKTQPTSFVISGYVIDGNNGEKISSTSIYEKQSSISAISDKYGFYSIEVKDKKVIEESIKLYINKAQYQDTVIYIKQKGNLITNISIYPLKSDIVPIDSSAINDSLFNVNQLAWVKMILGELEQANMENIAESFHKEFQFSFLPFVGTNLALSGNYVNDYSLNALIGYSKGTSKLEVGGLINIDRDSVKYVQLAGLGNVVGGPVEGFQAAGLFNLNFKKLNGVQMAGLINTNLDSVSGVSLAGLLNVNLKSVEGVAGAGLLNVAVKNVKGVQLAGLTNVTLHEVEGMQIAGLLNTSLKNLKGVQVSSLLNINLKNIDGMQISAGLNYAKKIKGSQVGLVNIADSIIGVPIGILSFVRTGYHKLEISGEETYPLNLSFRTGVKSFYNLFSAGMQFNDLSAHTWYFGYGIGTAIPLAKKWDFDFDLTVTQPMKENRLNYFMPLSKINFTFDYQLAKKFSIAFGPSFNIFYANTTDVDYDETFSQLAPWYFYNENQTDGYNLKMWLGGKVAIRFF